MRRNIRGSMTVEAALLYPFMLLITFLLIKITVYQYRVVVTQAAELFDAVFKEREFMTPELLRAADTAFDFFGK